MPVIIFYIRRVLYLMSSLPVGVKNLAVIGVDIDEPVSESTVSGPCALSLHPFVHFSEGLRVVIYRPEHRTRIFCRFYDEDASYQV